MNSILRQVNIRANDLREFIRSYDASNTTAVSIWAKAVASPLKPGTLVFVVEPVTLPFGLISLVRKEEEESLRVTDVAMVVRLDDDKAMVVSMSNTNYEMRFLETLFEEKARKALIDRKKFNFVLARPAAPLVATALKELERLASLYAKGGMRRSFMTDNGQPEEEPAMALFTACGVHLNNAGAPSKQPIDLGVICYALYGSDNKQPDSNRSQLKSHFMPQPGDVTLVGHDSLTPKTDAGTEKNPNWLQSNIEQQQSENRQKLDATGFNLLQSWGGEKSNNWGNNSLISQAAKAVASKLPSSADQPPKLQDLPVRPNQIPEVIETSVPNKPIDELPATNSQSVLIDANAEASLGQDLLQAENLISPQVVGDTIVKADDDEVYKHLSEAITDLLGPMAAPISKNETPAPASSPVLNKIPEPEQLPSKGETQRFVAARSFEKLPAFPNPLMPTPATLSIDASEPVDLNVPPKVLIEQSKVTTPPELPIPSAEMEIEIKAADVFSPLEITPEKLDDFQEPKIVMNEMASLMNKLDANLAKASKKLAVRASEIAEKLNANQDNLLNSVIQEDKNAYAELLIQSDALTKEFETLFDKLRTELAEKSANSREKIKNKLVAYQDKIQVNETDIRQTLNEEFKDYQIQFEKLVENQDKTLNKLISQETQILHERLEAIDQSLEETSAKVDSKLANYFSDYRQRVDEKVASLTKAFDFQISILSKNIEYSHTENTEKLKLSKIEFFNTLERLVKITEIALSRQVRAAQTTFFLPKLKERKQIIEAMIQEMRQTFAEHSFSQAKAQSEGAESSLVLARQQLKELMDERLAKLDVVGRNQQSGLEEIFKSAATPLEQYTSAVMQHLKQAEQEINDCESMCNKLAEAYNLDSDPSLTALRQDVYAKVDSLKARLRQDLESLLDNNCLRLESTTKKLHANLSAKRTELVQQVRLNSDKGLQRIRQAIHEAYNNVQTECEKYME